jgi:hypothetical protein
MTRDGTSKHHVWWERRDYKSSIEKRFRNHAGLVIPLNNDVHKFLHLVVPAPPKPMKEEIVECIQFMKDRDEWPHLDNPYWAMEACMQYFVYRGADQPQHEERAHDIRHNLAQQIGIMAGEHTVERPI